MCRWLLRIAGCGLSVCLFTTVNWGQEEEDPSADGTKVTAGELNADEEATVTVHIENMDPPEHLWKDLHLIAPRGKRFPNVSGSTVVVTPTSGAPQTWELDAGPGSSDKGYETITIYADDEDGFNGDASFDLDFGNDADDLDVRSINWELTDEGDEVDTTPLATDGGSTSPLHLPVATINVNGGGDLVAAIAAGAIVPCFTEPAFENRDFQVYTSSTLNPNYDDGLGLGINWDTDPVPSGWGLTFHDFGGTIASDGTPVVEPSITIPNDPLLDGEFFYVVFVVEPEAGGGGQGWASTPVKVTIDG